MKKSQVAIILFFCSWSLIFAQVLDPVIKISMAPDLQSWTEVAYNSVSDQYLVVWEDYRTQDSTKSDIYAQLVNGDGTLVGENFAVCTDTSNQYWPHVAFDPRHERYLVVFSDYRNGTLNQWGYEDWQGNYDVYGALLDKNGNLIETPHSEADGCFGISTHEAAIHYPVVSYNDLSGAFLVVWADYRHENSAIYGQIVDSQGGFLAPGDPSDPAVNFAIATQPDDLNKDVPDVSYSPLVDEWLIVYAQGDMSASSVYVQRVNQQGELLKRDGSKGAEALLVSADTKVGTDPAQPRVQFNHTAGSNMKKATTATPFCECLVVWRQKPNNDVDLYCQRIAFYSNAQAATLGLKDQASGEQTFYAVALTRDGVPSEMPPSIYPLSNAENAQGAAALAFSGEDNEFFAVWGDNRKGRLEKADLYGQRMWIDDNMNMVWLNEERSAPVEPDLNFPIMDTEHFEGGNLLGVVHNALRNEFFVVFAFEDQEAATPADIYAYRIAGSEPSVVHMAERTMPQEFDLLPNFPNPFNPETTIQYRISKAAYVEIAIYNPAGQKVKTLHHSRQPAGNHAVIWDGTTDSGQAAVSGLYLCRIQVDRAAKTQKLTLLR